MAERIDRFFALATDVAGSTRCILNLKFFFPFSLSLLIWRIIVSFYGIFFCVFDSECVAIFVGCRVYFFFGSPFLHWGRGLFVVAYEGGWLVQTFIAISNTKPRNKSRPLPYILEVCDLVLIWKKWFEIGKSFKNF